MKKSSILFLCAIITLFSSAVSASEQFCSDNLVNRIVTLNKMGWARGAEDEYNKEFIEYASKNNEEWSLEVGAAFGLTAAIAVSRGARLIVNDLDARHLDFFKNNLDKGLYSNIRLEVGNFLELDITSESINTILASRVLNMLSGEDIEKAAALMYKWLKYDGKVFIVATTTYQKVWADFIPCYEKNKKSGVKYPGEVFDIEVWNKIQSKNLPSFIHLLDIDVLTSIFEKAGFFVEKAGYIDRKERDEDKKESFGMVLTKKLL